MPPRSIMHTPSSAFFASATFWAACDWFCVRKSIPRNKKQPLSALADRGEFVRGTTLSCTSLFRLANRQRNVLETSAPTLFRAAAYGWASLPACWRLAPDAASLAAVAGKFSRSSHFVLKLKATHHCVLYIIAISFRFVKSSVKKCEEKSSKCSLERL